MIKINQKVLIKPFKHMAHDDIPDEEFDMEVEGIVKYINGTHRWFSVEYGEYGQRISYNFCDIGKSVILCD